MCVCMVCLLSCGLYGVTDVIHSDEQKVNSLTLALQLSQVCRTNKGGSLNFDFSLEQTSPLPNLLLPPSLLPMPYSQTMTPHSTSENLSSLQFFDTLPLSKHYVLTALNIIRGEYGG